MYQDLMLQLATLGLQNPQQLAQMAASKGVDPSILTNAMSGAGDSAAAQNLQAPAAPAAQPNIGAAIWNGSNMPTVPIPQVGVGPPPGGVVAQPGQGQGQAPAGGAAPAGGPSIDDMASAFGLLQSVQPQPSAQAPIAPAITPPRAQSQINPQLTQLLSGLLQPQGQPGGTQTLGEIIGGQYRGLGRR